MSDLARLLPADRAQRLEQVLARYESETGHQIAVVTVPTLAGEPIESFSLRVAESWRLGQRGADNGLLLVIAAQDRKARIEVGYGLEGVVPDAVAKRVIDDVMAPRFRDGDFAGGVEAASQALMAAARGEEIPDALRRRARGDGPRGGSDPVALVMFASILSSFLWLPFRGGRMRPLGAALGGATSGILVYVFLASLGWAAIGLVLGVLFGWMGPGLGRGRGGIGPVGWGGGGFGGGGGGGFSGGGGGFGGGGASGSW